MAYGGSGVIAGCARCRRSAVGDDRLLEFVAVVARRRADPLPEYAVEVGDIVEPAGIADFRDGVLGFDHHLCGAVDAEPVEIVPEIVAGALFEKAAHR